MIRILLHHILVKLDDATEADEIYKRAKAAGIHLELDKREQKAVEYVLLFKSDQQLLLITGVAQIL